MSRDVHMLIEASSPELESLTSAESSLVEPDRPAHPRSRRAAATPAQNTLAFTKEDVKPLMAPVCPVPCSQRPYSFSLPSHFGFAVQTSGLLSDQLHDSKVLHHPSTDASLAAAIGVVVGATVVHNSNSNNYRRHRVRLLCAHISKC
jgi:hypothetical protein